MRQAALSAREGRIASERVPAGPPASVPTRAPVDHRRATAAPSHTTITPTSAAPAADQRLPRPRWSLVAGVAAVAVPCLAISVISHWTQVLNPSPPIMLGVVLAAFLGGTRVGLVAAGLGGAFLVEFLTVPGSWFSYSGDSLAQVAVYLPAAVMMAGLVGSLQHRAHRRYLRERIHGERLAALERIKSQFLNVASHELRGPLGVVSGYIAMVEDGSLGPVDAVDMRRVAPVLSAKVNEMASLIDGMLETARVEEHSLTLKVGVLDLRDVARRAVEAVGPLASASHRVDWTPPRHPVPVLADPVRLSIIVQNLVHNAVKYSPAGGDVRCFLAVDGDTAAFSVWDHGLGIADEDMPRLFSRFGRLVTRENSHISGTGLGLYLARELARLHGGDITVRSQHGNGSAFTLTLPLHRA